jgi:hypothetical protein
MGMNTKAILALGGLVGAPLAVHAQSVTYDFTGNGDFCSNAGAGTDFTCVTGLAFTGTVTIDVIADGPSGPDSYTDATTASDDNGWVRSHFVIRWDGNVYEPAPTPGPQLYSNESARVENDNYYPGAVYQDTLVNGVYYVNETTPGSTCEIAAVLWRETPDPSWLSDLSFDLSVDLAPGSDANNYIWLVKNGQCSGSDFEGGDFYSRVDLTSLVRRTSVAIVDIKPGSAPNRINPKSNGVIPVAILGSVDFDATQVDSSTVLFGPGNASPVRDGRVADVNGDGYPDMLFHFSTQATGITCGSDSAPLSGTTFSDQTFEGSDSIRTAGCKR